MFCANFNYQTRPRACLKIHSCQPAESNFQTHPAAASVRLGMLHCLRMGLYQDKEKK